MRATLARAREPVETGRTECWPMNDRDVYVKLSAIAEELFALSDTAETYVGNAALRTAASTIAGTAKAVYDHVLGSDTEH